MKRLVPAAAALALLSAVPAAAQSNRPTATVGAFSYFETRDPITDTETSIVMVSEQARSFMPATLQWQCERDGNWNVVLDTQLLTMDDEVTAQWRFDQEAPQTAAWEMTRAHYAWVPVDDLDDFTAAAKRASRLAVRLTTRDGHEATLVFPMNGATAALSKLGCMKNPTGAAADSTSAKP
jgi:hypothetical protein